LNIPDGRKINEMTTHLCKHLNPTHPVFNQGKERAKRGHRGGIEGARRG